MFFLLISLCLSLVSPFLFLASAACTSFEHETPRNTEPKKSFQCVGKHERSVRFWVLEVVFLSGGDLLNVFRVHRKATSCNIAAATFSRKIFYHHHCIMMKKGGKTTFMCEARKILLLSFMHSVGCCESIFMNSKFGCCLMS